MAKDKKQKLLDENNKPNKDMELTNRLVGLFLIVFSVISVSSLGTIPSFISYIFAYLFGSLYVIVFAILIFIGFFMLFTKKQFKIIKYKQFLLFLGIFICALALCSISTTNDDELLFTNFVSKFNQRISIGKNAVDPELFIQGSYGGGIIGAFFVGLFNSLFTQTGSLIIFITLFIGFIGLLLYPLFVKISKKIKEIKKNNDEKKKSKLIKQQEDNEKKIHQQEELLKSQQETLNNQKRYQASYSVSNKNSRDFSKFDIFDELDEKNNKVDLEFEGTVEIPSIHDQNTSKVKIEDKPEIIIKPNDNLNFNVTKSNNDIKINKNPLFINEEVKIKENKSSQSQDLRNDDNELETINYDNYRLPPLYLLKDIVDQGLGEKNRQIALEKAEILNNKFQELNIAASIENFIVGPAVTQYEIVLKPGVRVNTFIGLQEDFKLALGASSLRIEAPIPGKTAIGIEVPNVYRTSVSLKEVLATLPNKKEKLYVAVGKDIAGSSISIPLVDMPHTLISGATNSGKSVCANAIIISLLMNYRPDEVQLIMVDLKRVEMLFYVDIPHLLCPIITEADHVGVMLEKLYKRMMDRFDIFAKTGVKNIGTYNRLQVENNQPKMPFIILIIDEFAELTLSKKTESVGKMIQRITQLGRAAGIHLILSTQRPSSNILEGDTKNNISGRMTFRLSSNVDSKVVIDVGGAEKLLNNGDMLLLTPFISGLKRIQGVYCSDEEIEAVVKFVKSQAKPHYDPEFLDLRTEDEIKMENSSKFLVNGNNKNDYDALYDDIKEFVITNQKASASLIQRRFQIGYNRAANYIDRLEAEGIIGPENSSKPREVLIKSLDELENNHDKKN